MAIRERRNYRANGFNGKTFENELIRVDGNAFWDCMFLNCTLEFGALQLPMFKNCRFKDSDWVFLDAAANMLAFLSQLPKDFGDPGKDLFRQLVQQLEGARLVPTDPPTLVAETRSASGPVSALVISATPQPATAGGTTRGGDQ